jgi:SAM-dependent methyltransferase
MASQEDQSKTPGESTYVVDAQSAAEMSRLMRQEKLLTRSMGGVFPENTDLTGIQRMLDLACGPGGWVLETAFAHPEIEVKGVDISERAVAYANAQARVQQLPNASFQAMNVLQPLAFPDASFDLVNERLIVGFMRPDKWPDLIQECLRILRPGGILRFTEFEPGFTNKPFLEKALGMVTRAMKFGGYTFSPDGLHFNIIPMLPGFFREAGLQNIQKMAHVIEFSEDTEARDSFYHDTAIGFQLVEPFIEKVGLATLEEWRGIYKKAIAEIFEDDFRAIWFFLTVWGHKPLENTEALRMSREHSSC